MALTGTVVTPAAATSTIALPATQSGANVTWFYYIWNIYYSSSYCNCHPVVLTATITKGAATDTKTFTVTVDNDVDTGADGTFDNATTVTP
ncbi:immunoglobulin-like domain-containing protein [Fictibacillus sp. KU28468]|uniref:immunoglobulin-like domain-containing protein n=1 Tax=Fictibacillus sp. KU28468 TaxID=2991053 RepID=UPI00223CCC67|nr:immunoglobulin-like domain-containing protein [Fictibacillus sp. KU28468]UZJ79582.1 hypothetical protein OKX00_03620 [Fictibacillus sp. KU28468]